MFKLLSTKWTLAIFRLFIVAPSVAEKAKHLLMLQKPTLDTLGVHSNIASLCYVLTNSYSRGVIAKNVFYNMFQLETPINIMLLKYVEPNFLYLCTIGTAVLKLKHHLVLLHCTEGSRQYQPNLKLKCWPNPQQASVHCARKRHSFWCVSNGDNAWWWWKMKTTLGSFLFCAW